MGKFKCAGCFKEIDYSLGNSLCYECFEYLCGNKVSWEDPPSNKEDNHGKEEKIHEKDGTKSTFQEKDGRTI